MVTAWAFIRRYKLMSFFMLEGALTLASITKSVITSWKGQEKMARQSALRRAR